MSKFILTATLVGLWAGMGLFTSTCPAADDFGDPEIRSNDTDDDWYYHDEPTQTRPSPQAIIQQKAQVRAQHRQSRIEAMNWYGMSNSRPTVSTDLRMSRSAWLVTCLTTASGSSRWCPSSPRGRAPSGGPAPGG